MRAYVVEAGTDALPEGWVWADRTELAGVYAVPSAFQSFSHLVEEHLAGGGQ